VVTALAFVALAAAVVGLARNPNIKWEVFANYIFDGQILNGLVATLELSFLSLLLGLVAGTVVAQAKMSRSDGLQRIADVYVWLFRGVPAIVQLLIWGNVGLFVPEITIPNPFADGGAIIIHTNTLMSPFVASVIGLGLHESAFMAEILRGGISSIDKGQLEAAAALGINHRRAMRRIVMPQALRIIVPPIGNQLMSLIKASALVSVISGGELLTAAQNIAANNYHVIELLFVATLWYLVVLAVIGLAQGLLERRLRRSER
jgi:polar amino acid transport system permease protein